MHKHACMEKCGKRTYLKFYDASEWIKRLFKRSSYMHLQYCMDLAWNIFNSWHLRLVFVKASMWCIHFYVIFVFQKANWTECCIIAFFLFVEFMSNTQIICNTISFTFWKNRYEKCENKSSWVCWKQAMTLSKLINKAVWKIHSPRINIICFSLFLKCGLCCSFSR